MTKFERQLEEFLQMFGSMEEDNFLEAAPDCQNAIAFLWEEYRKMKEKSGHIVVTVEGGEAKVSEFPKGFVTGVAIQDFDVTDDYPDLSYNEFDDAYQETIFEMKGEGENS